MGGGAPMSFLNKKSWHTGGHRNRESVWKREREHAEEQAKVKELQRQIEEEREQLELERLAEDGRALRHEQKKKKTERLDFMYNTPLASKALDDDRDAFLLGKKKVTDAVLTTAAKAGAGNPNMLGGEESKCERVTSMPTSELKEASRNENWLRLQNDPLLAIRRQQQSAMEKIKKNPVEMQRIREEVLRSRAAETPREGEGSGRRHHHRRRHRRHRYEGGEKDGHRDGHRSRRRSHRSSREAGGRRERSRSPAPGAARDGYGLSTGEAGTSQHAKGKFSAREKIEAAEKELERKRREEKNQAWSYGGKRGKHAVGKLSEEDLRRKREEMMTQGQRTHVARAVEARSERERDEAEEKRALASKGDPNFLDKFQKNIFGGGDGNKGLSLEDAVSRRKFYSQK